MGCIIRATFAVRDASYLETSKTFANAHGIAKSNGIRFRVTAWSEETLRFDASSLRPAELQPSNDFDRNRLRRRLRFSAALIRVRSFSQLRTYDQTISRT